ncbi:winged helix-turn-helix domain-containing protein [Ectothiorhodospira shaposhnikovii]|uniref:winged helix-turn-helix domain-containing protein n=1 Tax=Ectothiorhodospira shaposhnikovii TaxID=1054 RepID=UPI0039A08A04
MSQREIAEQLGVDYQTVGRWLAKYREGGVESLLRQQRGRRLGSGRQLAPDEEADLQELLRQHTPDQLEMPYALWSREAVQELIRQEIGLRMPTRSVGEYLKRWGFTVQTPKKQAYEQRSADVQQWLVVIRATGSFNIQIP